MDRKTVVVGIDGATFSVLDRFFDKDKLPFLKSFVEEGVHGRLDSVIPPISSPAWPCLYTGKNPGKIDIFDFLKTGEVKEKTERKTVNFSDVKSAPFWKYVDEDDEVCIVNVPITFPPREVNGTFVSGIDTPSEESEFTYPKDLKTLVPEGYRIETGKEDKRSKRVFLEATKDVLEKRAQLVQNILDRQDPELLFVVFTCTDRAQHFFWKEDEMLEEIFELVDSEIESIVEDNYDMRETDVFVISDHGFQSYDYSLNINTWLEKNGYLKRRSGGSLDLVSDTLSNLYRHFQKSGLEVLTSLIPASLMRKLVPFFHPPASEVEIDWEETEACGYGEGWGIFLKDGNDEELKKEIKKELEGEDFVKRVHTTNEIYRGEYLENGPDLLVVPEKNTWVNTRFGYRKAFTEREGGMWASDGTHDTNGVLMAKGPNIGEDKKINNADILDVAPTVLHLMGHAVPEDMDGRVLKEIFEEGSDPAEREVEYREGKVLSEEDVEVSEEDERRVRERLKNLGYLG